MHHEGLTTARTVRGELGRPRSAQRGNAEPESVAIPFVDAQTGLALECGETTLLGRDVNGPGLPGRIDRIGPFNGLSAEALDVLAIGKSDLSSLGEWSRQLLPIQFAVDELPGTIQ